MKFLLNLLFLFPSLLFAQTGKNETTIYILSDTSKNLELKRGVYYSFQEVLNNKPSDTSHFDIDRWSYTGFRKYGNASYQSDSIYFFTLKREGEQAVNAKKVKQPWGFSSGKNIYIMGSKEYLHMGYMKVLMMGRYIYYLDLVRPYKRYDIIEYVININNGETFELTEKALKSILKRDPVIFAKYKSEGNKRKEMKLKYLKLYCENHKEEVKVENKLGL